MEKYGQYRDKGTVSPLDIEPAYADSSGSGIAPFFPIAPPESNVFLAPYHLVRILRIHGSSERHQLISPVSLLREIAIAHLRLGGVAFRHPVGHSRQPAPQSKLVVYPGHSGYLVGGYTSGWSTKRVRPHHPTKTHVSGEHFY